MENRIRELLNKTSIESKKEIVSILIERAKNSEHNQQFLSIFENYLIDSKVILSNPFLTVGPKKGLSCFVSDFLCSYIQIKDFDLQIQGLGSLMQDLDNLHESKSPILKINTTQKLLEILRGLGARKYLIYNKSHVPIRFYFVPYGNKEMNAGYFPHLHLVTLYRNHLDPQSSPEYIFMHEIGHIIQLYFTGDQTRVPDSFKTIVANMFKPCSDEVLVEVFADCFSVAVMKDTPFEEFNPFCSVFLQEHQVLLKDYFSSLLNDK